VTIGAVALRLVLSSAAAWRVPRGKGSAKAVLFG
jgi:hypothetical protein